MAIYGHELMKPTSQEFVEQVAASPQAGDVSGIPNAIGNERLAPFEPVAGILVMKLYAPGLLSIPV